MSENYKPVNGATQLPTALSEAGNLKVSIEEGTVNLTTDTTVPDVDSTDNAVVADVVGNKTDAAVIVVGITESVMAYMKGVVNQLGDEVYGLSAQKTLLDTAQLDITSIKSTAEALPTQAELEASTVLALQDDVETAITTAHTVPVADSEANTLIRDVLGSKADSVEGGSVVALLKQIQASLASMDAKLDVIVANTSA